MQLLLLQTLDHLPGHQAILLSEKINIDSFADIEQSVASVLYAHKGDISLGIGTPDIQIHTATGALRDSEEKSAIIYPDKAKFQMLNASSDLAAMPVTPTHGTTTFFIKNPMPPGEQLVTCEELEHDQRSLDLTEWQPVLKEHGWSLIRPPRVRVFYANDVLYIGAEIPASMMAMGQEAYLAAVTDYTRSIASLVFPHINISELPVNPHLRSRFPTERGEHGEVLSTAHAYNMSWGEEERTANISVFNHGDSRYLPHYQTGSGFITGFLINEVYADIYQHKTFHDVYEWARVNGHLGIGTSEEKLEQKYAHIIEIGGDDVTEKMITQAFQSELFMALSRGIIEENKSKVGRYFNAIHSQSIAALKENFGEIVALYNDHNNTHLIANDFAELDTAIVVMQMLKENNIGFLRAILPQLLNKDFSVVDDDKLLHVRDMHLLDYEANLPNVKNRAQMVVQCDVLLNKEKFITSLKNLSTTQFDEWFIAYNKANHSHYKAAQFPAETHFIVAMEMLHRNGQNIAFLREIMPSLLGKNLSSQSDDAIFELRDQLTHGYMSFVDENILNNMASTLINQALTSGTHLGTSRAEQLLKLSIRVDHGNMQDVASELGLPILLKEQDRQGLSRVLLSKVAAKLAEEDLSDIASEALLPQTSDILQLHPAELREALQSIANEFATNKTVQQRAALSFFSGKHHSAINAFVSELRALDNKEVTPEQLKFRAVDALQRFHDKLESGHSRRAIALLNTTLAEFFPSARGSEHAL